ncbi:universal stress protein [Haliangium ochraceum]|uniref:UspA domain protein n=1 Tax=Haliangium ochraceum (strain DSM 14365 / JCM 11303 / SMP-2) TaxID=502025 RepID=D0LR95_HALO1|nr:universal stress protein [Haliangium ochraceum]ACY17123.1 UspA domain protein [Haliangium ochraceum DSM 14365]
MALTRFLVAVDFSPESETALAQAIFMAERAGAAMELLWVEDRLPFGGALSPTPANAELERMMDEFADEAARRLEALAERTRARVPEVTHFVGKGFPDEVIAAHAEAIQADLVVMGTKGLSGLKRFFLGSVAEKVIRTCHTNVLVARGPAHAFERVLVASDFSPVSERALHLTLTLAAPAAEVELFHAWHYPAGTIGMSTAAPKPGDPMALLHDQILDSNEQRGRAVIERAGQTTQTLRFAQHHGAPAAEIQNRLEASPFDLAVLSTHGHRGFRRFLLGSVAEATVRHAPCSVLVIHAGDEAEAEAPLGL